MACMRHCVYLWTWSISKQLLLASNIGVHSEQRRRRFTALNDVRIRMNHQPSHVQDFSLVVDDTKTSVTSTKAQQHSAYMKTTTPRKMADSRKLNRRRKLKRVRVCDALHRFADGSQFWMTLIYPRKTKKESIWRTKIMIKIGKMHDRKEISMNKTARCHVFSQWLAILLNISKICKHGRRKGIFPGGGVIMDFSECGQNVFVQSRVKMLNFILPSPKLRKKHFLLKSKKKNIKFHDPPPIPTPMPAML